MIKSALVAGVCLSLFAICECDALSAAASGNDHLPTGYYKLNNIPKVEEGCQIRFDCKRKLKHAESPKPCVKFCVKTIECTSGKRLPGLDGQCLELNEEMVTKEYNDCKNDADYNTKRIMPIAMIDFPCQPGYLPDSRGRCREVW